MNRKSTFFPSIVETALHSYSHEFYVLHQYKIFRPSKFKENLRSNNIYWIVYPVYHYRSDFRLKAHEWKFLRVNYICFVQIAWLSHRLTYGERWARFFFVASTPFRYQTVPYVYVIYGSYSSRYKWNGVYFPCKSKLSHHAISEYKWSLNTEQRQRHHHHNNVNKNKLIQIWIPFSHIGESDACRTHKTNFVRWRHACIRVFQANATICS